MTLRGAMLTRWTTTALICGAAMLTLVPAALGQAQQYRMEKVIRGSDFHGVHGLAVDAKGNLFAGSVVGMSIYRVDQRRNKVGLEIGPPEGMADDIAFAPDGTMAWTAFLSGAIYARKGNGPLQTLATGLPGINSLAYNKEGKLFASQVFLGDALYEIDTKGTAPPRKIAEKLGGLNGFEFGADGLLYGPLWFKGLVVKIDVKNGEITKVAEGFKIPAAVNFDSKGNLYVVDTALGELIKVDIKNGNKTIAAKLRPSLDNLAIDAADHIYVSNMADNSIQEVDPQTGRAKYIVKGQLAMPGGIALVEDKDGETVYIADVFAFRSVQIKTGKIRDIARMQADQLEYPFSITIDDKFIYLSSWFSGSVQKIDRKSLKTIDIFHDLKAPMDAIGLADGSILVAEFATGSLLKASGAGGRQRAILVKDLAGPVGMVPTGAGAVYVTESLNGQVTRIELANGARTVIARDLKQPEGIALAPDGNLIVADVGNKRLVSIEPKSGKVTVIADRLPIGLPAAPNTPPAYVPTGVAVSKAGVIYMSSDVENALYKFTRK